MAAAAALTRPDRVRGMLWGAAAGSAAGLPHETRDAFDLEQLDSTAVAERPHAAHFAHPAGCWSALLEPAFVALTSLRAKTAAYRAEPLEALLGGEDYQELLFHYADALSTWSREGFRAWKDPAAPYTIDPHTAIVLKQPAFLDTPLQCGQSTELLPVDGGSLIRMLAAATAPSAQRCEQLALGFTKVTHRGDQIAASNVFAALLLQSILYGGKTADVVAWPYERLRAHAQGETYSRLLRVLSQPELENVGGRDYLGRQIPAVRCFMYAFRACLRAEKAGTAPAEVWRTTLLAVLKQGGATDVHCALAGAVVGAWFGPAAVPGWRTELPRAEWLHEQIEACCAGAC